MLAFFGVDEDGRGAIEGNGENDLGIGASVSNGEDRVRVHIEVAIAFTKAVGGRKDVGERGGCGFNDFFNESQSCKGKREVAEMLLTLENFLLLLSSSRRLLWYCLTISGACTLSTGSQVLSLNG